MSSGINIIGNSTAEDEDCLPAKSRHELPGDEATCRTADGEASTHEYHQSTRIARGCVIGRQCDREWDAATQAEAGKTAQHGE